MESRRLFINPGGNGNEESLLLEELRGGRAPHSLRGNQYSKRRGDGNTTGCRLPSRVLAKFCVVCDVALLTLCVKMSAATESESDTVQRCASCGIAGGDDIKLKNCTACYLVKYCSVKCQKEHRPKHKKECKKRAAELRDEILFKQPESSHYGDCPICCLPLPFDPSKSNLYACCSKIICMGCTYTNKKREYDPRLEQKCPFCRKAAPDTDEEFIDLLMKRAEVNDPAAMNEMGAKRYHEGDYKSAFEYWTRAASLGDARAHYQLSTLYCHGRGVEKDKKKRMHHLTEAAIEGHPLARNGLGCIEWEHGRVDRAVKHWIIAAKLGFEKPLECVKDLYKDGVVSKEDFTAALRGYQTFINATKSPQREEAYAYELTEST